MLPSHFCSSLTFQISLGHRLYLKASSLIHTSQAAPAPPPVDVMQEQCRDAEVERLGLDTWWLVCSARTQKKNLSVKLFTSHISSYTLFFLFICFFSSPVTPTASPVVQHCDTSLASIIAGSDKPKGRGKSDNMWKIFPPVVDQLPQAKPRVYVL